MRPFYEQEQDRVAEQRIIDHVAKAWDLMPYKLPISYGLDFALCSGHQVKAFVEAKNRDWPFKQGNGFRISMLKTLRAMEIEVATRVPCLMTIRFRCGNIYWAPFQPVEGCIWAGRGDRGDVADMEPHIVVPWDDFQRI